MQAPAFFKGKTNLTLLVCAVVAALGLRALGQENSVSHLVLNRIESAAAKETSFASSDCDNDGDVDLNDFKSFLDCMGGPVENGGGPCDCAEFDEDRDGDVDYADFRHMQIDFEPDPPRGACCVPVTGCRDEMTVNGCHALGGAFLGVNLVCDGPGDRDFDGISNADEELGAGDSLDLPAMGANSCRKDIFVEADWVHSNSAPADRNKPHPNQVNRLVAAFADSGVPNPDGTTGITLHYDYGQPPYNGGNSVLDPSGNNTVDVVSGFSAGEYATIKAGNFAANRHGYFHYSVMCDRYSISGTYQNSSGLGELPGDDFLVSMGQWAVGDDNFIGNTIMHELGHNLDLRHGGFENRNFKPNYNSVMNYWYQFCGVDIDNDVIPDDVLDFSHGTYTVLNENNLHEAEGVTGIGPAINWNNDGDATDFALQRNINCRLTNTYANSNCFNHVQQNTTCGNFGACYDNSCAPLHDHDDWSAVELFHLNDADLVTPEIIHCTLDP